jgi:hypothetical protein
MAEEDWAKELARHIIVTVDRDRRRAIQRQQDVEAAKAASFASYAMSQGEIGGDSSPTAACGGTDGGPWRHRRRHSVFAKAAPIPHVPGIRGEPGGVGVFSPVTASRQDGVLVDLNLDYTADG